MSSSAAPIDRVLEARLQAVPRWAARRRPRAEWRWLIAALVVSDVLMVGAAFRAAYYLRFQTSLPWFQENVLTDIAYYQRVVLVLAPVWIAIFATLALYRREHLLGGTEEYARVFRGATIGLLLIVIAGFLKPELIIARGWVLLAWILTFLFVAIGRMMIRRLAYFLRRRGHFLSPALILGANREARLLADQLLSWDTSGLRLIGFVDGEADGGGPSASRLKVIGSFDHLDQLIAESGIEELILASSALSRERMLDIFRRYGTASGIQVRMSSGLYEIITTGLRVQEFAYVPLVGVNKVRLTGLDRVLKHGLDYSLTVPAVLLLLPLYLLLAILVKLDSPGPVFHRRRVVGINGRQFDAFKFRTMYTHGDSILERNLELKEELARNHKIKDDPRVTRLGRFMRRFSLDELPQLFNVLRHEMSLVGPRMISSGEMARYDEWGLNLLTVLPGITGLWQVSGRSEVGYEERVRLDMHYIRNWNIWLDLQLLWQTIPAVLRGRGAY